MNYILHSLAFGHLVLRCFEINWLIGGTNLANGGKMNSKLSSFHRAKLYLVTS